MINLIVEKVFQNQGPISKPCFKKWPVKKIVINKLQNIWSCGPINVGLIIVRMSFNAS